MMHLLLLLSQLSATTVDVPFSCAGVAMAENQERLAANPALLGSDPMDRSFHMRLGTGTRVPYQQWKIVEPHRDLLLNGNSDEILSDDDFLDALWELDGIPVSVRTATGLSFWQGDWAFSSSLEAHPGIRLDHGIVIPSVKLWDSLDAHFRFGIAQPFGDWRVGTGLHLRWQGGRVMKVGLRDPERLGDEVRSLQDSIRDDIHPQNGNWSAGLDLGVLRTLPWDLQAGFRLGDLGLQDRDGDLERPLMDAGVAWIPSRFHQGPRWARRVSVGMQLRDLLNTDLPTLGHLDFGVETRHNLAPRGIAIRSGAGLRGGWPCANAGLTLGPLIVDGALWVEDLDRVLGRTPLQNWDVQAQLGW